MRAERSLNRAHKPNFSGKCNLYKDNWAAFGWDIHHCFETAKQMGIELN